MSARVGFPNLAGSAPDAAAPLPIGSQIDAHSVVQVLSEGPSGFVYLTRDAAHGATRVLKEFMPRSRLLRLSDGSVRPCDVSDSIATSVARIAFMNEANTLAAFQHPALIRVLGVIPAYRTLYRVMPLVDGVSLEQHCRSRAEAPSVAWLHGLVEGLLQALQVLHDRRLGHGSLRPAQVMVRESGQPLLLGFASVARELDAVSPTPWQSPGAAHLTRHAPPLPADDLPALAETAFFAATGLQAPTLQQRAEGMPFDLRQALGALPDGPGDTQQRRRGLLLALEAAFAASTHARPQSVAEFRGLLTGDVPTRGGRYQPTPRWVGEMPERHYTEVDLLISQPAPLSDELPPVPRPVVTAATVVIAAPVAPVVPVVPVVSPIVVPTAAPADAAAPIEAEDRPASEAVWPFEPAPAVEPPPLIAPAVAQVPDAEPERTVDAEAAPLAQPLVCAEVPPSLPAPAPAVALAPERGFESPVGGRVERDFAATEFLVASTEPTDVAASFRAAAPDTEPFIASLRPQPPRRARSPYAAMVAMAVLALVGVGIAGWWNFNTDQASPSVLPSAQMPAATATPAETSTSVTPTITVPPAAPTAAAVPEAAPAPAQPEATAAAMSPPATPALPPAPATPEPTSTAPSLVAQTPPPVAQVEAAAPPMPADATAAPSSRSEAAAAAPAQAAPREPVATPAAAVGPVTPSRASRSTVAAAPAQRARTTAPQRSATVTAARTPKAVTAKPSAGNVRAAAAPNADASRTLRARSPLAACGSRTQFSLVYCMQQQCARPAYQSHPQCADVRNGG